MHPSRTDVSLLAVAAVWGSSYWAAQEAAAQLGVLPLLAVRFLVAGVVLALVAAVLRSGRPSRGEMRLGVVLGGSQALVLVLETWGVTRTTATNAGLLISLTVVLTPVLESLAGRRWLPRRFFVAVVVAVVGVAVLVSGDGLSAPTVGDAVMLLAAFVRSVHVTASGSLTRDRPVRTLTLTLVQTWVCALGFTALALPAGLAGAVVGAGAGTWWAVAWLGLACTVFAFLVQLWAVRATSAARASLLMGTEPVWAVAVGIGLAGDHLTWAVGLGAALVLAGTGWGQRVELQHRTAGVAGTAGPVSRPAGGVSAAGPRRR
ncbi:DMT family transporter [Modestobacter sp. Leaf380]|uniref:DMT family transporter n=1 Tax=Modestobacter sp. Leaf380 TaxID=1736356 RepID=UPI0006FA7966|nr:DMT family transporter [Modestobacter sp. Leaf380]KQS71195.1 hypothetical protein ASG41_20900 [Modestobacter sp. Leaf380]